MTEPSRVRNLAVLLVLCAIFIIPATFLDKGRMLDTVSGLMLIFGCIGLWLVWGEAWANFWEGNRDRFALGLYGLAALFLSVVTMRSYGIITRNSESASAFLEPTHTYAALVFLQFVGLMLFTRGAQTPSVAARRTKWGQWAAGIAIGILIGSSKFLEPILMWVSKLFTRMF